MFAGSSWPFLRKEHTLVHLLMEGCFLLLTTLAHYLVQVASTALGICLSQEGRDIENPSSLFSRLTVSCILSHGIVMKGKMCQHLVITELNCHFVSWALPVICSVPPTAGSLPLNSVRNEDLQVNSPAAWRVNGILQIIVRSVDVKCCTISSDSIWLQLHGIQFLALIPFTLYTESPSSLCMFLNSGGAQELELVLAWAGPRP